MGIEVGGTPLEIRRKHDMTKIWEGLEIKNKPEWEKREKDVKWARDNGLLEFSSEFSSRSPSELLSPIQKQVLNEVFSLSGGHRTWEEVKDKFTSFKSKKRFYKIVATGIRKIEMIMAGGRASNAGRPRKPGTEDSSIIDSRLRKNRGIEFRKKMGAPLKQVDENEFRSEVVQANNTNQLAKHFALSWPTIVRIAEGYNIQLPKLKRCPPGKIQPSSA